MLQFGFLFILNLGFSALDSRLCQCLMVPVERGSLMLYVLMIFYMVYELYRLIIMISNVYSRANFVDEEQ